MAAEKSRNQYADRSSQRTYPVSDRGRLGGYCRPSRGIPRSKITFHTELHDPATGETSTGVDISWYPPDIRRNIKSEITSHNFQGQQERQVIQLIKYDLR